MFFSDAALSLSHVVSKLQMPVSDLLHDVNSVWSKPGNDAYANHEMMRSMKVVRKPDKNNQLQTFQDLGGFQILFACKTSKDALAAFQGNPIIIIHKISTSVFGCCQIHFSDLVWMLNNLQNVNYIQWIPLRCVFARAEADKLSRKYNHDGSAVAGAMPPVKYELNTNRTIVEPTLCNIFLHMDAVYNWEPPMYAALALVAARCAQIVSDYSPGSDSKVVPLLIQHTLDQVASIFQSANIPRTMYIPPASATSLTAMPVETVQDIVVALSLVPFIANHGHVAAALGRIQIESYPSSTSSSTGQSTRGERRQKRPRQEPSTPTNVDRRVQGGSKYAPRQIDTKGSGDQRFCHDFLTTEGCSRPDCRYKHLASVPQHARERLTTWATRKGVVLRSNL
jgi:hypothetical protein